ncbi:hypothetical protein [Paracoccus laeviglucosivorans]|uniref:Uncharacterized protein n=1 Tax=Paracoccus laeviglucosivorans TaxID=1197861 RepID=A0A521E344_9RHOB|nr:hypothetical protein [Paracoccus laeviglucosivorans]SMO78358.1 hypothetical protein SAMN06265221_11119 [Paracoccus laeviglucosivorans]
MDAYGHLRVLVSLILGLSITRVLSGLSRRIQQPGRTQAMHAQIVWAFVLLLSAVHFWWWEFALRDIPVWHFGAYVFVLSYAALFFLMATLIFPDAATDHASSEDFFLRRRRWFFGLFALSFGFDLIDTLMKGTEHLRLLGPEYPLRLLAGAALALFATHPRNSSRRLAVLGLIWLLYDISWIARRYDSLG